MTARRNGTETGTLKTRMACLIRGSRANIVRDCRCCEPGKKDAVSTAQLNLARGARNARVDDMITLLGKEGAGNAGCALHPRPRVQQKSTRVSNHRYTASTGGFKRSSQHSLFSLMTAARQ